MLVERVESVATPPHSHYGGEGINPSKGTVTMKKLAPFMILVIIAAAAYALINRDSSDAV
ncbi:MAG: hypothetical protein DRJ50_10390 [Actinobacteria bacterium]|nr:MAG: hypothetical protein DRJ50_10390 [Actinomycetota bacterium]